MRRLRIEVPATSANLGPGFDVIGMALELVDTVHVELDEGNEEIVLCSTSAEVGPIDPHHNLFCDSYRHWGKAMGAALPGARFTVESRIPVTRGLGSSAACIVAGLAAAAHAAGHDHCTDRILTEASILEGHPDNAVAAVLGGVTAAFRDGDRIHALQLAVRLPLSIVVFVPEKQLLTAEARGSLPHTIPSEDAVFNLGRLSWLTIALATGRWELLGTAMEDRLHQPYRLRHVPAFADIIGAAREAGAYGAALSGSGPSVLAFCSDETAGNVAGAMKDAAQRHTSTGRSLITGVREKGFTLEDL